MWGVKPDMADSNQLMCICFWGSSGFAHWLCCSRFFVSLIRQFCTFRLKISSQVGIKRTVRNSSCFCIITVTEIFERDLLFIQTYVDCLTLLTYSHVIGSKGIAFLSEDFLEDILQVLKVALSGRMTWKRKSSFSNFQWWGFLRIELFSTRRQSRIQKLSCQFPLLQWKRRHKYKDN